MKIGLICRVEMTRNMFMCSIATTKLQQLLSETKMFGEIKLAFHHADTDIFARILADTRHVLKLFLWQVERHADIFPTILARMSVSASWSARFTAPCCAVPCRCERTISVKDILISEVLTTHVLIESHSFFFRPHVHHEWK